MAEAQPVDPPDGEGNRHHRLNRSNLSHAVPIQPSAPPKLRVMRLHKKFAGTPVLRGISFDVYPSEKFFLIGPSGSGKSTVLRCINHLVPPDDGQVLLDGSLVGTAKRGAGSIVKVSARATERMRARMPMVFQQFNLFANLDVLGNVTVSQRQVLKRSREEAEQIAYAMLERVGLKDKARAQVSTLSGGQQQRVGIARALAMQPEVILFDEPTSALDPETVGEVLSIMQDLASQGLTMIVVTHEMNFARRTADTVALIRDGLIVEQGPAQQVMDAPRSDYTRQFISALDTRGARP